MPIEVVGSIGSEGETFFAEVPTFSTGMKPGKQIAATRSTILKRLRVSHVISHFHQHHHFSPGDGARTTAATAAPTTPPPPSYPPPAEAGWASTVDDTKLLFMLHTGNSRAADTVHVASLPSPLFIFVLHFWFPLRLWSFFFTWSSSRSISFSPPPSPVFYAMFGLHCCFFLVWYWKCPALLMKHKCDTSREL